MTDREYFIMTSLQYENRELKRQVAAFESGGAYVRMEAEFEKALAKKDAQIRRLKKEVGELRMQLRRTIRAWQEANEDVLREAAASIKEKDAQIKRTEGKMLEAQRQRDAALDRLREKNAELYEAKGQLEDAEEKLRALTARVNKDHTNSSKPSSMDPNHKKIQNGREKSGRRPGGQPGHVHHPRKRHEPTRTVDVPVPAEYMDTEKYRPTGRTVTKQLVKAYVTTEVTEYRTPEFRNVATGQRVHAPFPEGLRDDVTYDGSVKAMAYLLNNSCYVSVGKTRQFLEESSGGRISLSDGFICGLSREFSQKTKGERDQIFLDLATAPVMHADFTFGRVDGRQAAVIVTATPEGTVLYQARERKGDEGVKGSPLEFYAGTLVSDHEAALVKHGSRHQECLSHVQRYVQGSIDNEPSLTWGRKTLEWIKESVAYWHEVDSGREEYDEAKAEALIRKYDEAMETGRREYEYEPPSPYYREGYNIHARMAKDREDYVLFLRDPSVPPTNNEAERDGRKFKRKSHQVMAFRSMEGASYFCDGLTILESLRRKGASLFEATAGFFSRNPDNDANPSCG